MHNPDSDKFYTLPEAFNALGRERFGKAWTGREIVARQLPDPKTIFPLTEAVRHDAGPHTFTLAEGLSGFENVKARWQAEDTAERIASLMRDTGLPHEIVTAALNRPAYEAEFQAFQRRTDIKQEFRQLFYSGGVGTELVNEDDGIRIPIRSTYWLAKKFTFSLSTGMAEWADRDTSSHLAYHSLPATTYKGRVLIERHQFDLAIKDVASGKETTDVDGVEGVEAGPSSGPSDNEKIDAKPPSLRDQKKALTKAQYEDWNNEVAAIKADRTLSHPLEAIEILRKVAFKFGKKASTVKRRLNRDYPGWSEYEQVGKK